MAHTNVAFYRNGQVAGESARSASHYVATNTSASGGGIYEDVAVNAGAEDPYCASAWVRTQAPSTGAACSFVVWLLGCSYNEKWGCFVYRVEQGVELETGADLWVCFDVA